MQTSYPTVTSTTRYWACVRRFPSRNFCIHLSPGCWSRGDGGRCVLRPSTPISLDWVALLVSSKEWSRWLESFPYHYYLALSMCRNCFDDFPNQHHHRSDARIASLWTTWILLVLGVFCGYTLFIDYSSWPWQSPLLPAPSQVVSWSPSQFCSSPSHFCSSSSTSASGSSSRC